MWYPTPNRSGLLLFGLAALAACSLTEDETNTPSVDTDEYEAGSEQPSGTSIRSKIDPITVITPKKESEVHSDIDGSFGMEEDGTSIDSTSGMADTGGSEGIDNHESATPMSNDQKGNTEVETADDPSDVEDGEDSESGSESEGGEGPKPPCIKSASEVVVVGDSYMYYLDMAARPIPYTEELAREAGQLEHNESYRFYAVPGTSLSTGAIPGQLTSAINDDSNIKLLIMDGGGNDVLLGARQCLNPGSSEESFCQDVVQNSMDTIAEMFQEAAEAGIEDVIYFFYPHIIENSVFGGPAPNEIADYTNPIVERVCSQAVIQTNGQLTCHYIDLCPVFEGHTFEYISSLDGVHPLPAGARVIGEEIWYIMEDNCLGHKASSGCCTP